jgi:hypothetical protein
VIKETLSRDSLVSKAVQEKHNIFSAIKWLYGTWNIKGGPTAEESPPNKSGNSLFWHSASGRMTAEVLRSRNNVLVRLR